VGPQQVSHHVAESGLGVNKPEGHYCELVVAVVGAERRLGDIFLGKADLVVTAMEVNLGEDSGAMKLIQDRVDPGQGVGVLDGDRVQCLVVHTKALVAIALVDKQYGGIEWGLRGPYEAFFD
jgi:hypothetical protein